jgi:hypothetical protein
MIIQHKTRKTKPATLSFNTKPETQNSKLLSLTLNPKLETRNPYFKEVFFDEFIDDNILN